MEILFFPRGKLMGRTFRDESHRIVAGTSRDGNVAQVEFYDHQIDPGKNVNIAAERPEVTNRLLQGTLRTSLPASETLVHEAGR